MSGIFPVGSFLLDVKNQILYLFKFKALDMLLDDAVHTFSLIIFLKNRKKARKKNNYIGKERKTTT